MNTLATLMTRGLAEMTRLGLALGADLETFSGMAGVADLTATCLSSKSRNHRVGECLGQGGSLAEATAQAGGTAEAVQSCLAIQQIAAEAGVEAPITDSVVAVLHGGEPIDKMGRELLARPLRSEGSRYEAWPGNTRA
jgi:glycerol-3-phosphate dehydrogenase (NAD(P)+)